MTDGFFEIVIQQSNKILAENETVPPADIALYSLGEVYAHHNYEGRDYTLSQQYFEKLIDNFPNSDLTVEAKTYISLFEAITAQKKEAATIKEKLLQKEIIVEKEKKTYPTTSRKLIENLNFAEAEKKNLQLLEEAGKNKPADTALYNLGLIYAHVDNPAKDYKRSKIYFHVLVTQFPESQFAEEARIWLGLFETLEKIQQIDIDIEQQKKQLNR